MANEWIIFLQISDLENDLHVKEKSIAQLESKLQSQADYDQIKRELTWVTDFIISLSNELSIMFFFFFIYSILKSIEFSTSNRSNDDQTENLPQKPFETLLLEKNRPLQGEQTQMKVPQTDSESKPN